MLRSTFTLQDVVFTIGKSITSDNYLLHLLKSVTPRKLCDTATS